MTTLLTPQKLVSLRQLTKEALRQASGDMAEVGVYRGGSARAMLLTMERIHQHRAMHLFDTFEGLPEPGPEDGGFHRAGQFAAGLCEVMELLDPWALLTRYYPGTFPDSATGLGAFFSIVHVDVDLYKSVRACCEWFAPRMSRGGIIVFDDYSARTTPGCPAAVDEFFGDRVEVTPSGPAVVRF